MEITKAVITAARRTQRSLPLQTIIDSDGVEKSVLRILVEEVIDAGVDEICVIVYPGDEAAYAATVGEHAGRLQFVQQAEQLGYAHAVYCAREFVGGDSFLHLVGDHLYVRPEGGRCTAGVVEAARSHNCSVSAVQATRETLLPFFGAVGGHRLAGQTGLYQVETVIEKPTPTEAEQRLVASGLRAGHYLCFFWHSRPDGGRHGDFGRAVLVREWCRSGCAPRCWPVAFGGLGSSGPEGAVSGPRAAGYAS